MKVDSFSVLVRDRQALPAGGGDSCAETCRAFILGRTDLSVDFFNPDGVFVRHPTHYSDPVFGPHSFTNDQLLPLMMANLIKGKMLDIGFPKIKGTDILLAPLVVALKFRLYWLVNILNVIQGLIFKFPYRWSDDGRLKDRLFPIEKSEGKVQDYLNYIITYMFLLKMGKKATMITDKETLTNAVRKYYLEGPDPEPNSQWIVDLYETALVRVGA